MEAPRMFTARGDGWWREGVGTMAVGVRRIPSLPQEVASHLTGTLPKRFNIT